MYPFEKRLLDLEAQLRVQGKLVKRLIKRRVPQFKPSNKFIKKLMTIIIER